MVSLSSSSPVIDRTVATFSATPDDRIDHFVGALQACHADDVTPIRHIWCQRLAPIGATVLSDLDMNTCPPTRSVRISWFEISCLESTIRSSGSCRPYLGRKMVADFIYACDV